MINLQRPSTACQLHRPSLTDTGNQGIHTEKYYVTKSYTYDGLQPCQQQHQQTVAPLPPRPATAYAGQQIELQPAKQQQQTAKPLPARPATAYAGQHDARLGRSLLSNDNWRQATMADVRLNAKAIEQSDRNILYGKGIDPVPHTRELLCELSNAEALFYARQCRLVVSKLRLCWNDVNEEIKSLAKVKDYTDAAIDHMRKDLVINKDSHTMRKKPTRESEPDGVDDILSAEKYHLLKIKRVLEINCRNVINQMQRLDEIRQRVAKINKERSTVTELICQCLTSASRTFEAARTEKLSNMYHRRSPSAQTYRSRRQKANLLNSAESNLLDENGFPLVGHLQPFTPDVIQVFDDAAKSIDESCEIKKQTMNQIKDAFNDAKAYSLTVNQSIAQKLADIITLAQHLTVSLGDNMLAQNRAQRWHDLTMSAQRTNAGPQSSSNLKTCERFDRPIIQTFQRHPGNQLSEVQMAMKTTTDLQQSANETEKQLKTLKIVGQRLQANLTDKEAALEVDCQLLRQRRGRSNHKWAATKYIHA
ncbi:unnamed protein product [Adineta ricciae]|uniref:Tektin n=1 Tax=Adineta ricciae TaxID=249248 RepID=A0A814XIZ8_ADIRI|nr:unnamed protein product [Adineta ricciae]